MVAMSTGELTMTVEEAAKALRIGRSLAYELARRGELPTIRLGKRLLVPKAGLDRMLGAVSQRAESSYPDDDRAA